MTDDAANVTQLRPSPRKGEGLPARKTDRTNAERQRRFKQRRKEQRSGGAVTDRVTPLPPPVPKFEDGSSPAHAVDVAAYCAAIALAGAAAWFSIRGMAVLFPGAPQAVVGMAVAMESAKLVTTGWLARRWRNTAWTWRVILVALVAGLVLINAAGVYAQLVAAHLGERGAATAAVETQDAALAARIEVAAHTVADLDRRLGQIDTAIETAATRGKTNTALSAIEGQRRARASLASERNEAADTLGKPQGRTRQRGRARPPHGIRSRAHPVRRRAGRCGYRQRASDPVVYSVDGAMLRPVRHRIDRGGFGAAINRGLKLRRARRAFRAYCPLTLNPGANTHAAPP